MVIIVWTHDLIYKIKKDLQQNKSFEIYSLKNPA